MAEEQLGVTAIKGGKRNRAGYLRYAEDTMMEGGRPKPYAKWAKEGAAKKEKLSDVVTGE